MSSIYSLDFQKNLFLYTAENFIFLRNATGEALERAIVLGNDYASDMTDVILDNTLYFAYKNLKKDIVIRSITDLNTLYKLSSQEAPDCLKPSLTILNNQLILFYLVKNPLDNSYCMKSICPFEQERTVLLHKNFSVVPMLHFCPLTNGLLVVMEEAEREEIVYIHNDYTVMQLSSFEEELSNRIEHMQAEHMAKMQTVENNYTSQLAKTEAGFSAQITALKSELYKKNKMIESAKIQYNELMDTATKYRDEALKWREKFYRED